MSFFKRIKAFFTGPVPDDLDLDDSGELAVPLDTVGRDTPAWAGRGRDRDKRLLPKRPPKNRWLPKKRVMEREEANRLFSPSLRTRNYNIRTLGTDGQRLRHLGLPVWKTDADVAQALGLSKSRLYYFASHREDDTVCHYVCFRIPKRSGGTRLILAPKRELRAVQRAVLRELVERMPVSEAAHGFRRNRSVRTNAAPHVGKAVVVRFDLESFFPSVTFGRVRGLLLSYGYSYPVATTLALLMTEAERQPVVSGEQTFYVPLGQRHCVQGAPTSPGLCNSVVEKLDHRLAGLARSLGFAYTRYADDLTFSGDEPGQIAVLLRAVSAIVADEGFALNDKKTRVMREGGAQRVTGVTVNETLGLSRKERRKIRAQIHNARRDGIAPGDQASLEGKLAYIHMLNPGQAEALRKGWQP